MFISVHVRGFVDPYLRHNLCPPSEENPSKCVGWEDINLKLTFFQHAFDLLQQDIKDDTLLGLGSTARRFGDNTKLWLTGFSCLMMSNLAMTGVLADLAWPYYLGLGGVAAHLMWQVRIRNN